MDIDTWVSTLAVIGAIFALYFSLRRDLKSEIAEVKAEIKGEIVRLEGRINTLDDRVYGLAVGLKPVIDEAAARAPRT